MSVLFTSRRGTEGNEVDIESAPLRQEFRLGRGAAARIGGNLPMTLGAARLVAPHTTSEEPGKAIQESHE